VRKLMATRSSCVARSLGRRDQRVLQGGGQHRCRRRGGGSTAAKELFNSANRVYFLKVPPGIKDACKGKKAMTHLLGVAD